jgi:putative flavoprotein involved in K+ transport
MGGVRQAERVETVIVGGGQAGLAVGYHLSRRDRPFVILEANPRVGDSWRGRWDSLRLFTPARYDGLPGLPYPASAWSFPGKDDMADYIEAYVTRFDLPVRTGVSVSRLVREGDVFVATAGDRRYEAHNVVVAAGGFQRPQVPDFADELDSAILHLHSSHYRRPSQLRPGQVLVVGAANSGADIALELSQSHRTWLSGRHPGSEPVRPGSLSDRLVTAPFWFVASHVLTVRTPMGRKLRSTLLSHGHPLARVKPRDLDAAGVERVPRTIGVRNGSPVLEDGRRVDVSNVIWCTGFRPDFGWIDLPVIGDAGQPVHERGVVSAEPGLYFVGLPFQYALTSSLVGGVGRDAEHIAKHIVSNGARRDSGIAVGDLSTRPRERR